ncbi:MAG: glutamine-hydrolyzing carbamoyl-phosphate synthase small subunit [Anaerolineae bacterium]
MNTATESRPALLVLEDGTSFEGWGVGALGECYGEMVFNTGMTGYQEVLTDPSYCGQIVVMTYPEVGIYGVNPEDVESRDLQVAGFVVHRAVHEPFNQRAASSFVDYLAQAGIVAIEGVDTRALTRHLRTHGAMRGGISTRELNPERLAARVRECPRMEGLALAGEVTSEGVEVYRERRDGEPHVVLVDAGTKLGIARELARCGAAVTLAPYDVDVDTVLSLAPDGVLVSNGPGDPEPLDATIDLMRDLLAQRVPLGGICLGHQLLGLAVGGETYKMRFGHRGSNHPVKRMDGGQIVITTQNHGFAVDPTSLGIRWAPLDTAFRPARPELCELPPTEATTTMAERLPNEALVGTSPLGFGPIEVTHLSLNDGTVEGLRLRDYPAFSVQFHPEAAPGPHDARAFFEAYVAMIRGHHA